MHGPATRNSNRNCKLRFSTALLKSEAPPGHQLINGRCDELRGLSKGWSMGSSCPIFKGLEGIEYTCVLRWVSFRLGRWMHQMSQCRRFSKRTRLALSGRPEGDG